ncbi:MAG TPA: CheR family methyltransferase [Myxococcaceae bacterium]|jgi:chemotaxis protein methyltransferase CheR
MARGNALKLSPVAAYVAERTGSSLSIQQVSRLSAIVDARLSSISEDEYLAHLRTPGGASELAELMSAIVVHKTDLFRDEVQLRAFEHSVLKPKARATSRPLHLWSAGCATGEEVATLLILLAEAGAHAQSTVLGTDISEPALRQARELAFHPSSLKRIPEAIRQRYFINRGGQVQLIPELRGRALFARHNLMDSPYPVSPAGQGFDVIFCRNVLIYFTDAAFDRVVEGLGERIRMGGTLVLSSAEPLLRPKAGLSLIKCDEAFFYARQVPPQPGPPAALPPGLTPNPRPPLHVVRGPTPRPVETPRGPLLAAVSPQTPRAPMPAMSTPQIPMRAVVPPPPPEEPAVEARQIFELVLEWAAAGDAEQQTEQGLRKCLYLDPHFAQARYLLGMLLEQRGELADAASEYRRAASALREGRSRQTPFFLNDERLLIACERALDRVGFR